MHGRTGLHGNEGQGALCLRLAVRSGRRSVAACAGRHVVAVLQTGMGEDGADALGVVRDAGGRTIAQDEATSAVFGMPRVAIERGHAGTIAPLDRIAATIVRELDQRESDGPAFAAVAP